MPELTTDAIDRQTLAIVTAILVAASDLRLTQQTDLPAAPADERLRADIQRAREIVRAFSGAD